MNRALIPIVQAALMLCAGCNLVTGASSLGVEDGAGSAAGGREPGANDSDGGAAAGLGHGASHPGTGGTAGSAGGSGASGAGDPGCQPNCANRQCGPDGCGAECGSCSAEQACTSAGVCVGSPPGPAALRFDVATFQCGASFPSCTIDGVDYADCCPAVIDGDPKNKCFCQPELDHLNVGPSHFIAVASDAHKGDIWAAGNVQAVYVDDLNSLWGSGSGEDKADEVMNAADASFHGAVPKWFVVNELSFRLWPDDADYRMYVRTFAARLHGHYGKELIVASPFPNPGANATDWTALKGNAYIAPEVQLTGAEVNASGNSVSWCVSHYQDTVQHYAAVGVPLGRLVLVDNFSNTTAGTGYGRAGVSEQGWRNAIATRATAAAEIGFAGYLSYAWAGNPLAVDEATRLGFEDASTSILLP
jgi:hypothetical protein